VTIINAFLILSSIRKWFAQAPHLNIQTEKPAMRVPFFCDQSKKKRGNKQKEHGVRSRGQTHALSVSVSGAT
jgi:hypothetical protein